MARKITTAEFIRNAQAIHGVGKYDYSQVIYTKAKAKVSIICLSHGVFNQNPNNHLSGKRCPKCAIAKTTERLTYTLEEFVSRAQTIHGTKYDYSQSNYTGAQNELTIICPEHGPFKYKPALHLLSKSGCPNCSKGMPLDTESYIAKARAIYGHAYSYEQCVYTGWRGKVTIICPSHGPFKQEANSHTQGHGCPACAAALQRFSWSQRMLGRPATLYLLRLFNEKEEFYKIGVTGYSVEHRYPACMLSGYSYEILAQHTSTDAARIYDWEQSILNTFAHLKYIPTQPFGGASECFSSAEEILEIFPL